MLKVDGILEQQARNIAEWHRGVNPTEKDPPFTFIQENNQWNYRLWHEEDIARKPDIDPVRMVAAKRNIDHYNQQRNNAMEKIDEWVASYLSNIRAVNNAMHSETPGMMIDRLSIMALKKYHMQEEAVRESASEKHRQRCFDMVSLLDLQIGDLAKCLTDVLGRLENGELQFRVYRQMKMYNDPALNPELYNGHFAETPAAKIKKLR
jgi:hypothetical protein